MERDAADELVNPDVPGSHDEVMDMNSRVDTGARKKQNLTSTSDAASGPSISKVKKSQGKPFTPPADVYKPLSEGLRNLVAPGFVKGLRKFADDFPADPKDAGAVDFRKLYHQFADVMEGKPIVDDNAKVLANTILGITKEVLDEKKSEEDQASFTNNL